MPRHWLALGLLGCLVGCAQTREARLADEIASSWLQPESKEPLIVCGIEIPWKDDDDQAQGTAVLKGKATDTAKILLRESLRKVRLSGGVTIGKLMTQGGTALVVADAILAIAQDIFPPSMGRDACDEYDIAAVKQKIAEVQSFIDEGDWLSHFPEKNNLADPANARYFSLRLAHFQEWAEAMENESSPEEIAAFRRKLDANTLKICLRDPYAQPECDLRIENDRRKQAGEPLLDVDAIMYEREFGKAKFETAAAFHESRLRDLEIAGRGQEAEAERATLKGMGRWDDSCRCVVHDREGLAGDR